MFASWLRLALVPVRWLGFLVLATAQYALILIFGIVCLVVFRILNRTIVVHGRQFPLRPRTVWISNHQTLLDSFCAGFAALYPDLFWKPWLLPWHLADAKNFFANAPLRLLFRLLRAIPVQRAANGDRRDQTAYGAAKRALRRGLLWVFPEGTRSKDDQLLRFRPGPAAIILETEAWVVPVHFSGMHDVQPHQSQPDDVPDWIKPVLNGRLNWIVRFVNRLRWLFRFRTGHRIWITIGRPIPPTEISFRAGDGRPRERAERLATFLHDEVERLRLMTLFARSSS